MPGFATTCITVFDNDTFLSGDSWCNENANDGKGQHASIAGPDGEAGNGRQIYAESYYWVRDDAGKWYIMVEIEQEGSGDDYFTFYTGHGYTVPAAGTQLYVHSQCNVTSDWLNYNCLGAGDKNPWKFDEDTCTYTLEAEAWDLHNFHVVEGSNASGGELVKISAHDGRLSTHFGGESGVYNMTICAQDECDGASKLMVYVNGEFQQTVKLDRNTDGWGSDHGRFSAFTLQGLEIAEGDKVEIRAWKNGGEFVRIDAIKFEMVKFAMCDDPEAVKIDFEGFATGAVLTNQLQGITISAMGGSNQAMIFDSQSRALATCSSACSMARATSLRRPSRRTTAPMPSRGSTRATTGSTSRPSATARSSSTAGQRSERCRQPRSCPLDRRTGLRGAGHPYRLDRPVRHLGTDGQRRGGQLHRDRSGARRHGGRSDRRGCDRHVRELFGGISDMTMWRWLNDETLNFPRPVMIQRRRFWREAELIAWIEGRSA